MAPVGEVMGSWAVSVSESFSPEDVVFSLLFILLLSIILLALCTNCERRSFELQDDGKEVDRTQSQLVRVVTMEYALATRENHMINDIRKDERDVNPIHEDSVPEQLGTGFKHWRTHRVAPDQQGDSPGALQIANGSPVALTIISPSPPTTRDIGDLRDVLNFTPELHSMLAPISMADKPLESVPTPVYSGDTLDTPIMNVLQTLLVDNPIVDSLAPVDAPIVNNLDLLEAPAEFSSNFIAQLEEESQMEGEDQGPSMGVRPEHTYEIIGELTPDEPSVEVDLATPAVLVHKSTTQPDNDTTMFTEPADQATPGYQTIAELIHESTTLPDNEQIINTVTDPGEGLDLTSPLSLVEEVEEGWSDRGWNPMYARVSRKVSKCPTPPPVPPPEDEEEEEYLPPLPERSE